MNIKRYLKPNNYLQFAKHKLINLYYPSKKTKIVHTRFNGVEMLVRANEDVGKGILNKSFEADELDFILNWLKDDAVFFDVGANTGLFSLRAAAKSSKIQVHAFDPIKLNTALLLSSIEINSLENITVNQTCVGDYDGMVEFSVSSDSAYSSIKDSGRKSEHKKIKLPIIKLDTYIENNSISKIDFMKIDVEGAEMMVIEGASAVFHNNVKPKLMMIELYDKNLVAFNTSVKEIVIFVEKLGYSTHILIGDKLETYNNEIHANKIYNIFFLENQHD